MKTFKEFGLCLFNQDMMPTALKVSVVVGSILLFIINHGSALIKGQMNRDRWISAGVTYLIPYIVNIHGQYVSRSRKR
ncbi:nitrate/nitrite transporter NrtS [Fischerella sp. NIES-3754]|uniref:nitrate/nitrite transporter NrtS n=1 Tax=Fischerella sp. NIES-3754 TaxID=1752063 RepID=UPI0015D70BCA|nr:nitrate/nitrite transporter NrtS [Fischerella sp. NIES-3754]